MAKVFIVFEEIRMVFAGRRGRTEIKNIVKNYRVKEYG